MYDINIRMQRLEISRVKYRKNVYREKIETIKYIRVF